MKKILIIDDDCNIITVSSAIIRTIIPDCLVMSAPSGKEGVSLAIEQQPDTILLDLFMPGMNGYEVCRILKENPETQTIPIIIMTGVMTDSESRIKSLEYGADAFLIKPIETAEFKAQVKAMLRIRQIEIELLTQKNLLEKKVEERTKELEMTCKELKKTQAKAIQSEKLASIGQLAAGIAHEINNPTGFVSSNLLTLHEYIADLKNILNEYVCLVELLNENSLSGKLPNQVSACIENIKALESKIDITFILSDIDTLILESREGTDRIKKIVTDLKNFAHPGQDKLKEVDLNSCIESTLNVVRNELKYKAVIEKDYGALPIVTCYPQQLNQVFMNLFVNAAQAIEKSGIIKITTKVDSDFIIVKVSDTGMGIPEENLSRIFDPFFTTKEAGKGTGLGLNLAYSIVAKHNGSITVDSTVGMGSTFTVTIPVTLKETKNSDS